MSRPYSNSTVVALTACMAFLCALLAQGMVMSQHSERPHVEISFHESTQGQLPVGPVVALNPDPKKTTDLLIDAIIQVESAGDPQCVGLAGERGLMQIKRTTWKQVVTKLLGKPVSFDHAFDPVLNRRVGRAYLAELQGFLQHNKPLWKSDERSLLLAAYNAGPECVQKAGFDIEKVPSSTQTYIECATALHEFYLADSAPKVRQLLMVQTDRPGYEQNSSMAPGASSFL
ncbi:MAG: lytic transglycosylase domain-containing protein [Lentisphaerota bacterium]